MTTISSKKVEVKNSAENIFNFLVDFNNFEKIMPKDKISNWSSNTNECSFEINGLSSIGMKIEQTSPFKSLKMVSQGKNPFSFTLDVVLEEIGVDRVDSQMIFNGDINSFLKLVVEKPLSNFFNQLVENLGQVEIKK